MSRNILISIVAALSILASGVAGAVVGSSLPSEPEPIVTVRGAVGVGADTAFLGDPIVTVSGEVGITD